MQNRTKIICTIGPASESRGVLRKMMSAGMDCVRINASHGNEREYRSIIEQVRELSTECNREIGVLFDLQGPKIRIGKVPGGSLAFKKNEILVFTGSAHSHGIPLQYKKLPQEVSRGDILLIDDGAIEARVVKTDRTAFSVQMQHAGVLKSNKGLAVPGARLSAPALSKKDKKDVIFAARQGVDFVALSFVRSARDIQELRKILTRLKSHAGIIAKIERHEALGCLDEIIEAADGIMVARGDLGIDTPAAAVPILQKKIISHCITLGKPVIVATQMLQSMIENPSATRAEISDAANAIFDRADALMLSNETAVGAYPVNATRTLSQTATAAERALATYQITRESHRELPMFDAVCMAAAQCAGRIKAHLIVALTRSGFTLNELAKHRPMTPILCISQNLHTIRKSSLIWGVTKTIHTAIDFSALTEQIRALIRREKLAKKGDAIVICSASNRGSQSMITTVLV